jgi:hypothetical protein
MTDTLRIHPPDIRRRLWKSGGLLAIFILTLIVTNFFMPSDRAVTRDMLGHDFLPFYTAGTMARQGNYQQLYDLAAIKAMESATGHSAGFTTGFGPFWNPPFVAWLFAPFTLLSFSNALILWELFSAAALVASIAIMSRWIPDGTHWRNWGLIAILTATSSPLIAVLTHAQNTCFTLLLMTITITLWRQRRALAAGLVAGLLFYKPQHAPLIALALIVTLGWRAAVGLTITCASLAVMTLFTMPGAITDYTHKLPIIAQTMQELSPYAWDRHVTLKAFWRLLFQGTAAGPTGWPALVLWGSTEAATALLLLKQILRARRDAQQFDRAIALTILAGPLLALFCFDYDLLILAAPGVLLADEALRRGANRPVLASWIILFISLHVTTYIARPTHFVLATPALVAVALTTALARKEKTIAAHEIQIESRAIAA